VQPTTTDLPRRAVQKNGGPAGSGGSGAGLHAARARPRVALFACIAEVGASLRPHALALTKSSAGIAGESFGLNQALAWGFLSGERALRYFDDFGIPAMIGLF